MSEPKEIEIEFCMKCKWLLRSSWMAQELISTFGDNIKAVKLIPGEGGIFEIRSEGVTLWSLKINGRFPEVKELKKTVRDFIKPDMELGHIDR